MKSFISISFFSQVETNDLPICNVMFRGVVVHTVAGSFFASLQLTKNHMAPVSNIADTVNPWVLIGKYKRPYCMLTLPNSG